MSENTKCNLCDNPGSLDEAAESNSIASHVRCFSNDRFTVWRCGNCNSLHSKEAVDLNKYYADYPFKHHRLDFHTRVGYRNRLRLLKRKGFRPDHSLLDYGCGKALFVKFLHKRGYPKVQGYDPFIEEVSDQNPLAARYDVVTSYDVIEHVEDPREFLSLMVALVKPGGMLVLGTPNADEIDLFDKNGPVVELSQPYHRHILSARSLFKLAEEFDLAVVDIYRRFYFDSLVPSVNTRFMWTYIRETGGMIDVAVEPLKLGKVLRSPKLMFFALTGYFAPPGGNILVTFRRRPVLC